MSSIEANRQQNLTEAGSKINHTHTRLTSKLKCQDDRSDIFLFFDFRYRQFWGKNGFFAAIFFDAMAGQTEAREPDVVAESLQAVLKQSSSAWQDPVWKKGKR